MAATQRIIGVQTKRATRKAMSEMRIVEANGRNIFLPKILNLKSPGKRPIPSLSSQGSAEASTMSVIKITNNQRITVALPAASAHADS
jgi:hypothetical protein